MEAKGKNEGRRLGNSLVERTGQVEGLGFQGCLPTHMPFRDADQVGGDCNVSPVT